MIKKLFNIIEIDAGQMTSHHRLGPRTKNGIRPIRIVMKSAGKKAELMSHLWKLRSGSPKTTHGKKDRKSDDGSQWLMTETETKNKKETLTSNGKFEELHDAECGSPRVAFNLRRF